MAQAEPTAFQYLLHQQAVGVDVAQLQPLPVKEFMVLTQLVEAFAFMQVS